MFQKTEVMAMMINFVTTVSMLYQGSLWELSQQPEYNTPLRLPAMHTLPTEAGILTLNFPPKLSARAALTLLPSLFATHRSM